MDVLLVFGMSFTYRASVDTPRSSMVGFSLILLMGVQFCSGLFALSRAVESPEILSTSVFLHRAIPPFLVVLLLIHVFRSVSSLPVVGVDAVKTGFYVFITFVLTLGSGYMISAAGEAGFWGAVVSLFNMLGLTTASVLSVSRAAQLSGTGIAVDSGLVFSVAAGTTTVAYVTLITVVIAVHGSSAVALAFAIMWHLVTTHIVGSSAFAAIRRAVRSSLFIDVEARDLRSSFLCAVASAFYIAPSVWLFRLGNGVLINTELKPPAKVATEIYFSGVYAGFRFITLISCGVFVLVFLVTFIPGILSGMPFAAKYTIAGFAFISACFFSVVGFVSENVRKLVVSRLVVCLLFVALLSVPAVCEQWHGPVLRDLLTELSDGTNRLRRAGRQFHIPSSEVDVGAYVMTCLHFHNRLNLILQAGIEDEMIRQAVERLAYWLKYQAEHIYVSCLSGVGCLEDLCQMTVDRLVDTYTYDCSTPQFRNVDLKTLMRCQTRYLHQLKATPQPAATLGWMPSDGVPDFKMLMRSQIQHMRRSETAFGTPAFGGPDCAPAGEVWSPRRRPAVVLAGRVSERS